MNEPVRKQHEKMKKLWNKYSRVDLHSEGDNWLQTGAIVDSTELRHTENKFILNKFQPAATDVFNTKWERAKGEWRVSSLLAISKHLKKKTIFFHLCCYGFSQGRKSLYNAAVYVIKGISHQFHVVKWHSFSCSYAFGNDTCSAMHAISMTGFKGVL